MIRTSELLAAVRAAQGVPSNYRLARLLDVPEKTVSRWNTGKHTPDDAMAQRLAELAGLDPGEVLASMAAERAGDEATRAAWRAIAERLAATAAAVFFALGIGGGPDAHAGQLDAGPVAVVAAGVKIMSTAVRRALRAVASLIGWNAPSVAGVALS
jgi:transcriptional regulator with XRE-family HTH domain